MTDIQIFWTTLLGLPILVTCVILAIPSFRQQIRQFYKRWRIPLEQRYAKEIAVGDVVIIKASPHAKRNLFLLIAMLALIMVFFGILIDYLADSKDQCVSVLGVNASIFLFLINFLAYLWPFFFRSLGESFSARFEKKYPLFGDQVVHHTAEKTFKDALSFRKCPIVSSLAVILITLLLLRVHKPHMPCVPQVNAVSQSS